MIRSPKISQSTGFEVSFKQDSQMICSWFALAFSINSGTLNINFSSEIDDGGCRVEPMSLLENILNINAGLIYGGDEKMKTAL